MKAHKIIKIANEAITEFNQGNLSRWYANNQMKVKILEIATPQVLGITWSELLNELRG